MPPFNPRDRRARRQYYGTKPKPAAGRPSRGGGGGKTQTTSTKAQTSQASSSAVGFNPEQMAKTLTDLGYGAQMADIQRAIEENARRELAAMADLTDWTNQVQAQRGAGQAALGQVWSDAVAGSEASQANINNLFGESAAGEAAAYGGAGTDMLRALGAGDQAFMGMMAPILEQQGVDYKRRAAGDFAAERRGLQDELSQVGTEKINAYNANLMEMMQLGWERENQLFEQKRATTGDAFDRRMAQLQSRQAQQALNQAAALFPGQKQAQDLENQAQAQAMQIAAQNAQIDAQLTPLQMEQQRIANQRARAELRALEQQGVDPADPQARMQVASAALAGTVNPRGILNMNPRLAFKSAMDTLAAMGLDKDPQYVVAVLKNFEVLLRKAHGRGAWKKWSMKNGRLVYNPGRSGGGAGSAGAANRPETVRGGN